MINRRVVASLTTMPDRYQKVVKMLKSLKNQSYKLDAIYLSLPERSRRLNIDYPPIPEEISNLCTVVRCVDYGPITKIVGALISEHFDDTIIITFDDDQLYPYTLVETLVNLHKRFPDAAIGSSGMLLKQECPLCAIYPAGTEMIFQVPKFQVQPCGRRVDSIYGYPGALYLRKHFPIDNLLEEEFLKYALINHECFMNDDIVISAYLSMKNVDRIIFPDVPVPAHVVNSVTRTRERTVSEISYDLDKFFQRMNIAIRTCKSLGMYAITEPMDPSETVVGVGMILFFVILIIIILTIMKIQAYRPLDIFNYITNGWI